MAKTKQEMLLTEFNRIIGGFLRANNVNNIERFTGLLNAGMSYDTICNHMVDWYASNPTPTTKQAKDTYMETALVKFFGYAMSKKNIPPTSKEFVNGKRIIVEPTRVEPIVEPKVEPIKKEPVASNAESEAAGFLTGMINLVADQIIKTKTDDITSAVKQEAINSIKKFVEDNYGELPKKVIVKVNDDEIREVHGIVHERFEDVLNCVRRHLNVFMVGGAGTGKNVIAEQIAEALGVPFYFGGAITQEYKLTGFTDANGVYHSTPFYEAFTKGGVYFQDEADASIAEAMIISNSATSNGYMDFPAPIGNVKAHKDFYYIAAGNTYGLGADYEYVGRNVLDAATLNRMVVIPVDYSPKIEEAMANNDGDLLNFCRKFREAARKCGVKALCTYRNIKAMSVLSDCMPTDKIINYCLTSSMKFDDMSVMNSYMGGCGRWSAGYKTILEQKRALV